MCLFHAFISLYMAAKWFSSWLPLRNSPGDSWCLMRRLFIFYIFALRIMLTFQAPLQKHLAALLMDLSLDSLSQRLSGRHTLLRALHGEDTIELMVNVVPSPKQETLIYNRQIKSASFCSFIQPLENV